MMRKPEHPPLTLVAITQWLETKPPEQEYIWQDPTECVVGHYLRDHGSSWGTVAYSDMPNYHEIAGAKPWTFGAALERAKTLALLPSPAPAITLSNMELLTDGREPHAEQKDRALIGPDRPAEHQ